ncbi:hypothetical protein AB675_8021 [Lecanosticta acicola]|uniref:Uncharacterized protein n=1 Tax=Lecanosticta acicola TaxID=111012 RepID=A0AAI8Z1D1_9PEZI|nr:hypothetical protein AB675_8021 [Lecanosticta acicola]
MSDHEQSHDKPCTMCGTPRPVLVRCQIDESKTWNFICPGDCWKKVSGGVEDARGFEDEFPHYRYGGMWKNKHVDGAKMSAKKPKKVKQKQQEKRAEKERQASQDATWTAKDASDKQDSADLAH